MVTRGNIAPDLRKFPDDKARFFTTVKRGKNGKMPPMGDILNDEQIATLWAFASAGERHERPLASQLACVAIRYGPATGWRPIR